MAHLLPPHVVLEVIVDLLQGSDRTTRWTTQVQTGALAGLVSVVDWWADGNGTGRTGVRAAEVVGKALENVWVQLVLVDDGDVAGWTLGTLKIAAGCVLVHMLAKKDEQDGMGEKLTEQPGRHRSL